MKRFFLTLGFAIMSLFLVAQYISPFAPGAGYTPKFFTQGTWCFKGKYDVSCDCFLDTICIVVTADTAYIWSNTGRVGVDTIIFADHTMIWTAYVDTGDWQLIGNSGTVDGTNFIGTTDNVPLNFRVNNRKAGSVDSVLTRCNYGYKAGNINTALYNTFIGYNSGLVSNAISNTGVGWNTLVKNTSGSSNTAIGTNAMGESTTGLCNVAVGCNALQSNTIAGYNTTVGFHSLSGNTTGIENAAFGWDALLSNTTGNYNTAVGTRALAYQNGAGPTENYNIGVGYYAGFRSYGLSNRLYVGSGDYLTMKKDSTCRIIFGLMNIYGDSSAQKLRLNAQVSIGEGWKLPFFDGAASEVLTTDGSGNVTWQPAGGGGYCPWDTLAGVIYPSDTTDTVMIGHDANVGTELFGVKNGAVMFSGTVGATPMSGAGTRFMWIPAKAAFRAGFTNAAAWDDVNVGTNSAAFGEDNLVSGTSSFAAGQYNTVAGPNGSAAIGYSNSASGQFSCAIGYGNISSSNSTFVCGNGNTASNLRAFASGYYTTASGYNTAAFNDQTISQSYDGSVFGRFNIIAGTTSSWVSTDPLFVIGNGSGVYGTGKYNDAFRLNKNASGWIQKDSATTKLIEWNTIDSTTTFLNCIKLIPQAIPPGSPAEGMIYSDTDHHLYFFDGTIWRQLD